MATYTALQVITLARTFIDRDGTDGGVTDAQLIPIVSAQYFSLRRRINEIAPDIYTASVTFTIASGASTYAIVAADFDKVLKLERLYGSDYYPVPLAPILTSATMVGYRNVAGTISVSPTSDAPGGYRLTYLQKPAAALAATGDNLTLPETGELVLALEVAGLIRPRFDEAPGEIQTAANAWAQLREALVNQYAATPQQIAEIY